MQVPTDKDKIPDGESCFKVTVGGAEMFVRPDLVCTAPSKRSSEGYYGVDDNDDDEATCIQPSRSKRPRLQLGEVTEDELHAGVIPRPSSNPSVANVSSNDDDDTFGDEPPSPPAPDAELSPEKCPKTIRQSEFQNAKASRLEFEAAHPASKRTYKPTLKTTVETAKQDSGK